MAKRRIYTRFSAPLAAVALGLSLTACDAAIPGGTKTVTKSAESSNSDSSSNSSSDTSSSSSSSSDSPSSDSSSSSSSDTSSDSSSASSDSSSDSSSSSSSSGDEISQSEFMSLAKSNSVRACTILDMDYISAAQFCKVDKGDMTAKYKSQMLYVTAATEGSSTDKFSFKASAGGRSEEKPFDLGSSSGSGALSLTAKVPMEVSGDYTVEFKKNGNTFATKTVKVTVD